MPKQIIKNPYVPQAVVYFAVGRRALGAKWKDIQREIKAFYDIEPPCERQMRLWFQQWGPNATLEGPSAPMEGLKERLVRLQNTYKYLSNDSAFNREMATTGLMLQHIDSIASRSPMDRDNRIESIVSVLTLIERWSGASVLEEALREFQLVKKADSLAFDDTWVQTEKAEFTDEKPKSRLEQLAEYCLEKGLENDQQLP